MVKSRIVRATAIAATSFGLVAGLAGVAGASAGVINTTGPDSTNKIVTVNKSHMDVDNNNHLYLSSENSQAASSGNAKVSHNTTGGDAKSGNASNSTALAASVTISNGSSMGMDGVTTSNGDGTIKNTGPDSENKIVTINKTSVNVENNNCLTVTTSNEQSASTGNASVKDNTTGGDATSGNASNSSSSSFTINIQN